MKLWDHIADFFKNVHDKPETPDFSSWVTPDLFEDLEGQSAHTPEYLFQLSPLTTFYRFGPSMLTFRYPVDTEPLKEIYEETGLIGPKGYSQLALAHMREWSNEWFQKNQEDHEHLHADLLKLARKYNKVGAYSLLGSIETEFFQQQKHWKYGAESGSPQAMVAYAESLYTTGRTDEGFQWLKRGADLGNSLGCLLTAISYEYGTLSQVDLSRAAHYYRVAYKVHQDYYAANNLGCMMVAHGYYHSALKVFQDARRIYEINPEEWTGWGSMEDYLENEQSLQEILEYPYPKRARRCVMQEHSRNLDKIFLVGTKNVLPQTSNGVDTRTLVWEPDQQEFQIDGQDYADRRAMLPVSQRQTDHLEDYVFISVPMELDDFKIHGTQHEIIFLEKNCHAELNGYIQDHYHSLKQMFRSLNYHFLYLPAHEHDLDDLDDLIGSYLDDHYAPDNVYSDGWELSNFSETDYWNAMLDMDKLPADCAGFLHYKPDPKYPEEHTHYEYILFPHRPGSDWPRAFALFIDYLSRQPFVKFEGDEEKQLQNDNRLPLGSKLVIDGQAQVKVVDAAGQTLVQVALTPLPKIVLLMLLNHPEGVAIKNWVDYTDELFGYYKKIMKDKAKKENIDTLVDSTGNSANEKLSRIKLAFTTALQEKYKDDLPLFLPTGKKGEPYKIPLDRSRVEIKL